MTGFDSSVVTQPFNLSVLVSDGTEQLKTLLAPSWVSTPNVRGTLEILQSCILTLVACIYTALHLDVPKKTTWQYLLSEKLKWAIITLVAPEVSVFVAAVQLRYAFNLKSKLLEIRKTRQESTDFEINLKYAFFIVMGAVRFDVQDILSLSDIDRFHFDTFENAGRDRHSVRSAPASVTWFAERGCWVKIRKQDIDDKSKANTIQKTLVLIQVLWMVTQCIARHTSNLPISLLEIHTIVHVVCAVFLYVCWFEKPLDVQEAIIIPTESFKGELSVMLQRYFYRDVSCKMALFPQKRSEEESPPLDIDGSQMRWVNHPDELTIREGDILPTGLALCISKAQKLPNSSEYQIVPQSQPDGLTFPLENQFLNRWRAILAIDPSKSREWSDEFRKVIRRANRQHGEPQDPDDLKRVVYLPTVKELEPAGWVTDGERLFWETESIVHLHLKDESDKIKEKGWRKSIMESDLTLLSWQFILLAIFLTGMYGGVHLSIWGQAFPSHVEDIMWKVSCLVLVSLIPAVIFIFLTCMPLLMLLQGEKRSDYVVVRMMRNMTDYLIASSLVLLSVALFFIYISARAFVIVESFLCLRRAPVGIFLSPEWLQLFPHF